MFRKQSRRRHNRLPKCQVVVFLSGRTINVSALPPDKTEGGRKHPRLLRSRNSCHCNRKSASVPPPNRSTSGLLSTERIGTFPCALNLILPPADQSLVMFWSQILQPQRILHYRIRSQPRRIPVCAQKCVDRFKRNFQPSQPKRSMRPRIQPDVNQLIVVQSLTLALRPRLICDLQVALPLRRFPSQFRFIRIDAPSTGHNTTSGDRRRPFRFPIDAPQFTFIPLLSCTSIAPYPPTMMSSSTCSENDRNESSGFGAVKVLRKDLAHAPPHSGIASSEYPCRGCNPPTHSRNAILNAIDRPPRDRNLRKSSQVVSRRFRHRMFPAARKN
jgi:hypothetical protein